MNTEQLQELEEITDALRGDFGEVGKFKEAVYHSDMYGHDCESIPSCEFYTRQYLWKIEALKWFIAKIDAGEVVV